MKTELVNRVAKEAIYHLQYYINLYPTHTKINKFLLIIFSTIIISLIAFHVYYYIKS